MVCRCSTTAEHASRAAEFARSSADRAKQRLTDEVRELKEEIATLTPDTSKFEVLDVVEVGSNMVVKAKYPSCVNCDFEGTKIMVFLNANAVKAIRWRKIDPHFRAGPFDTNEAPSPAARFPNTEEGWKDAVAYAAHKNI